MNPEEVRFRLHFRSLENEINICGIILNYFEYENEKVFKDNF